MERIIQIAVDQYGRERFIVTSEGRVFEMSSNSHRWNEMRKDMLPPLHNEIDHEAKEDEFCYLGCRIGYCIKSSCDKVCRCKI